MATKYYQNCCECFQFIKRHPTSLLQGLHICKRQFNTNAIIGQSKVLSLESSFLGSLTFHKSMMYPQFVRPTVVASLLGSYSEGLCAKQKYSTYRHLSYTLDRCCTLKRTYDTVDLCSNKNMTTSAFTSKYGSSILCSIQNKARLTSPINIATSLQFSSSARANIDSSDGSKQPSLFQKLYRKVIPERLSVSKTILHRSGTLLSACCTHEVIRLVLLY